MGVPSNITVIPLVGITFDSSRAFVGSATVPITVLLFGQKTATGVGPVETQITISNPDDAAQQGGFGSMIHRMALRYYDNNQVTDTVIMLLDDAAGSAAATTVLTITGTATSVGEFVLYIDGDRYAVGVAVDDTETTVGSAIATLVNADPNAPVTALSVAGVVTFTAKNKGVAAGDVDIRLSYNQGEKVPAGLAGAVADTTPGTVDPDVDDVLDNISDTWFNVWASGYNDTTSLGKIEDFIESIAGAVEQRDGMYYFAKKDTRANLISFATASGRNSPYVSMIAATNTPHSNHEIAAAYAGRVAESIQEDPAIPLHRMTLTGLLPKATTDRWTLQERNQLANSGIATLTHSQGVQTEATVTMYLKNSAGAVDIAYQLQNSVFILMRLRYTFVQRILSRYARAKLADSAERIGSGQLVLTPAKGRAEAVAWFKAEERAGQVENLEQFKAELIVRRQAGNPNGMEWLLPPDLINQFIIGSGDMQFRLQS